ncbi:MAG: hypothetical protein HY006_03505 [Candidatus Sungbacteria bacterium]|nr:hypothetical protein [Candidatus Sungbacteria bacterium]
MANSITLFKSLPPAQRKLLGWSLIGVIAGLILMWLWSNLSYTAFLRTSAIGVENETDESTSSGVWVRLQDPAAPWSIEYPSDWKVGKQQTGDPAVYVFDLKNIKLWIYAKPSKNDGQTASQFLNSAEANLMHWPAKIGSTSGSMWAKASIVEGTKAPIGPRVYITNNGATTAVLILPQPPYSDTQLRIMNSFTAK